MSARYWRPDRKIAKLHELYNKHNMRHICDVFYSGCGSKGDVYVRMYRCDCGRYGIDEMAQDVGTDSGSNPGPYWDCTRLYTRGKQVWGRVSRHNLRV